MYGGSGEAQSERLGPGVQQPPETAPERTFGDGQGGGMFAILSSPGNLRVSLGSPVTL